MDRYSWPDRPNLTDLDEVRRTVRTFLPPGRITEIRALGVILPDSEYRPVYSGFFDSAEATVESLATFPEARGIYFLPNPVNSALLDRARNRLIPARRGMATSDEDVLARVHMGVDLDPVRPGGTSSTDAELMAAAARAEQIAADLQGDGWPSPVVAMSGNGYNLCYRTELPTDEGGLLSRALAALSQRYSDSRVKVDTQVGNPARGLRLYGTWARKGEDLPDRPHRQSRLVSVPDHWCAVPPLLLARLATEVPAARRRRSCFPKASGFDIESWIDRHQLDVTGPRPWKDKRIWLFPVCPWNEAHTNRAAYIVQFADGGITAGCHHNGCSGRGWPELRDVVEPGWREREAGIWVPPDAPLAIVNAYRSHALKKRRSYR